MLRAAPRRYSPDIRARIADELGRQISVTLPCPGGHGDQLCSARWIVRKPSRLWRACLLPPADTHRHLKSIGATAFTKLGYAPAAEFVYRWNDFGLRSHDDIYFFKELLGIIREASLDFRHALADVALQQVSNPSGTPDHVKAVAVLAYLGDGRLVSHLESRLSVERPAQRL